MSVSKCEGVLCVRVREEWDVWWMCALSVSVGSYLATIECMVNVQMFWCVICIVWCEHSLSSSKELNKTRVFLNILQNSKNSEITCYCGG